jgi:hypothetical protein
MLQDRTRKLEINLHILVKGLIILRRPKATFGITFHSNIILIMDFCTFKVDAHKTLKTKCLAAFIFFWGTKIKPSKHSNGDE